MLYSKTKQQTKLNERLLTSSVFRENLPFFQGCSKKQITCVSQIQQFVRGCPYHGLVPVSTQWRCFLQRAYINAYIGAFNIQNNEKSKRRKVINKENKRNVNDGDVHDNDDDDDNNKMVESLPELFLQLAEQAEICRTSCDLLKSCPDGNGKFTHHIVSARGQKYGHKVVFTSS